ncbi:hypothetical protein [Trujillonella humicola]
MPSVLRKLAASLAVLAAAAVLPVFAEVAAFRDGADPFPHSVVGATAQR